MRTGQKQGTENARGCSVLGDVGDVRPAIPCKCNTHDAVTAFKNLASAAKGRWDGVGAMEYVKALRL